MCGPRGNVIAEDDDGGSGVGSLIQLDLTESGTRRILIRGFEWDFGLRSGDYTLSME